MQTTNQDESQQLSMPIISELDHFLYPFMISPIFISNLNFIKTVEFAMNHSFPIIITPIKPNADVEELTINKIYPAGVIGSIMRKTILPDGRIKILFQGIKKVKITKIISENPIIGEYEAIETSEKSEIRTRAILSILKDKIAELLKYSSKIPQDILNTINDSNELDRISDIITSSLSLSLDQAYELYIESNIENRMFSILEKLDNEIESAKIQRDIKTKVQNNIAQHNKEHFLKEQLKQIQKELGVDSQREEEIEEYRKKLEAKKDFMSEDAYKEINKQIKRLSRMHPDSADANMAQTYLEWILEIPFGKESKHKLSIPEVENQLNIDHYSLKKPKDRILEYFAVRELLDLRGVKDSQNRGIILCFYGPPGVGKTSLANSIATAMKRKLVRIALGGLEDVNELRGHRRTYVGAMPGRIVSGLIEAKEINPIIVLDEIDKLGRSPRGDPTSAMLEILDPEQNSKFRDYYLNFDIDLSKAIFIATANDISMIPAPLRDRMEFIAINSYTPMEKYHIAKKYLIPQELKKHGLKSNEIIVSKKSLEDIINLYTREAGVRNLRRRISSVVRKSAKKILENSSIAKISITAKNLKEFLDNSLFGIEKIDPTAKIGIVNGLAWTSVGGAILKIEVIKTEGKGGIKLTGKLGEVMRESGSIAFSVVKNLFETGYLIDNPNFKFHKNNEKDIEIQNIDEVEKPEIENLKIVKKYKNIANFYDLHIHIPDGATPKDGPSAGITIATAIASSLSEKAVRGDTAMTGEISLHGNVMPIGGLKEKIIAAHRAGIKNIIIPKKNYERDLEDLPQEILVDLKLIPVSHFEEVLKFMFDLKYIDKELKNSQNNQKININGVENESESESEEIRDNQ